MSSLLSRAALGTAMMLVIMLRWSAADAQPAPGTSAPPPASQQAEAKKLTNAAIAAESAKDYDNAIALYWRAYQLVPHPILLFNIGQAYMLTSNSAEAEKYFRHYLERDPNGRGASIARQFLASLPAAAGSPPPATSTPQAASAPSSGTIEATPSDAAREQRKRAANTTFAGYVFTGLGVALGGVAVGFLANGYDNVGLGMGLGAFGVTLGGLVLAAHGGKQLRAAKAVAWSPVIGSGYAGVALSGSLP
jgi:tetratricopeptide (TPR) repeat protein